MLPEKKCALSTIDTVSALKKGSTVSSNITHHMLGCNCPHLVEVWDAALKRNVCSFHNRQCWLWKSVLRESLAPSLVHISLLAVCGQSFYKPLSQSLTQWDRSISRQVEDPMLEPEPRPKLAPPDYHIMHQNLLDDPVEKQVLVRSAFSLNFVTVSVYSSGLKESSSRLKTSSVPQQVELKL